MKTPREVLIERHRAIEPKLDAIRRQVLGTQAEGVRQTPERVSWLANLWQQLVLPCRGAWAGMSLAWVVILLLRASTNEPSPAVPAPLARQTADVIALLKEQRRLRNELLGSAASERAQPPHALQPHSEAPPASGTACLSRRWEIV